jgi:hypothetical protein
MSTTQLTIALAIAALINQWAIAIFNKRAKQAIPSEKPVSNVAPKAKRSFHQYIFLGSDLFILCASVFVLWQLDSKTPPHAVLTVYAVTMISFLVMFICVSSYNVMRGLVQLLVRP